MPIGAREGQTSFVESLIVAVAERPKFIGGGRGKMSRAGKVDRIPQGQDPIGQSPPGLPPAWY
jgi:hypothetical protein